MLVWSNEYIAVELTLKWIAVDKFISLRKEFLENQQDATYSVCYISVGSSTCFGCWHPSSGASTPVITASGID